jgi:hypothetical protein
VPFGTTVTPSITTFSARVAASTLGSVTNGATAIFECALSAVCVCAAIDVVAINPNNIIFFIVKPPHFEEREVSSEQNFHK